MEEAQFKCNITLTQLYNIPAPYIIYEWMHIQFLQIPEDKRSHLGEVSYSYSLPMGHREREYDKFPDYPVLLALNAFFNRDNTFFLYKQKDEPIINNLNRFSMVKHTLNFHENLRKLLKFLEKYNINSSEILIRVPEICPQEDTYMTDEQYSDYVLGYRIVKEYFEPVLKIEYYKDNIINLKEF